MNRIMLTGVAMSHLFTTAQADRPIRLPATLAIHENSLSIPMRFVENGSASRFVANGRGYRLEIDPAAARLRVAKTNGRKLTSEDILTMSWVGASGKSVIGAGRSEGTVNMMLGNRRERWKTGLRAFERVICPDVYPGIDMVYYGNDGKLEYDFIVKPGRNANRIMLALSGGRPTVQSDGSLKVTMRSRAVAWHKPIAYQTIHGVRKSVSSRYVLDNKSGRVRFAVGAYDPRKPLVIDPALVWSTYVGGSNLDTSTGIAVDAQGNIYITGFTLSPDLATTPGVVKPVGNFPGYLCSFVTKLKPNGAGVVYTTYVGGSYTDVARAIACDSAGNAWVTGDAGSPNFPTTPGAIQTTGWGFGNDAFLCKISADGKQLLYSTYMAGDNVDEGHAVKLDSVGNVYVAGRTASTNFITTANAYQKTNHGIFDAFIWKLAPVGATYVLAYATLFGGSSDETGEALAINDAGIASITGDVMSYDMPTKNAFQPTHIGGRDVLVASFDTTLSGGASLIFATYLGGTYNEDDAILEGGIGMDPSGNIFVCGTTNSPAFPTTVGAYNPNYTFNDDVFVAKFSPTGTLLASTYLGGTGSDLGYDLCMDAFGRPVIVGSTDSAAFPMTHTLAPVNNFTTHIFVTVMNPSLSGIDFSTRLGGNNYEWAYAVASDNFGGIYVTGETGSSTFPTTAGAYDTSFNGNRDAFVLKIALDNPVPTLISLNPSTVLKGTGPTTVTLTGTNFIPSSIARFKGLNRVTTYVNHTTLKMVLPKVDTSALGTFPVTVFNPAPGGGTSNSLPFVVDRPNIVIDSVLAVYRTKLDVGGSSYITVSLKLKNTGLVTAPQAVLTKGLIGSIPTTAVLPISMGDVLPGGTFNVDLTFPGTVGAAPKKMSVKVGGTYVPGGSFSSSVTITLPP